MAKKKQSRGAAWLEAVLAARDAQSHLESALSDLIDLQSEYLTDNDMRAIEDAFARSETTDNFARALHRIQATKTLREVAAEPIAASPAEAFEGERS